VGNAALLTVLPRREYDFAALNTNRGIGFAIAKNVWVEPWSTGVLLVRQHFAGLAPGATATITVRASLPSAEDPDRDFVASTNLGQVTLAPPSPALLTAALDLEEAGFISVWLDAARAAAPGPVTVGISIDLVARSRN
jgi:hypothetical protein